MTTELRRLLDKQRAQGITPPYLTWEQVEAILATTERLQAVADAARDDCERDSWAMFRCRNHDAQFAASAERCAVWHARLRAALDAADLSSKP